MLCEMRGNGGGIGNLPTLGKYVCGVGGGCKPVPALGWKVWCRRGSFKIRSLVVQNAWRWRGYITSVPALGWKSVVQAWSMRGRDQMKNGIDFFRFPCQTDDKLAMLEAEYGIKAFAIIVRLYQKIYGENGYYCDWCEGSPVLFLSKWFGGNSGVELNFINEIIVRAVKLGIFSEEKFEKYQILTSEEIQQHYLFAVKRRSNICLKNDYSLVQCAQNEKNVNKNDKNVSKNEKLHTEIDKVNKSKVKDSIYIVPEQQAEKERPKAELTDTKKRTIAKEKGLKPLPTKEGKSYIPDDEHVKDWLSLYPDADIGHEFLKMFGWLTSRQERKKTMRGMNRFVNGWLCRAQDDILEKKRKAARTAHSRFHFDGRTYGDDLEEKLLQIN